MTSPSDRCFTCGQTWEWHQDHQPRHPFNHGQDGATDFLKRRGDRDPRRTTPSAQRGAEGPQLPSDPVLRIALINRGVIIPADLVVAEEQLRQALQEVDRHEGEVQERTAASVDVGQCTEGGQEVGAQPEHQQE